MFWYTKDEPEIPKAKNWISVCPRNRLSLISVMSFFVAVATPPVTRFSLGKLSRKRRDPTNRIAENIAKITKITRHVVNSNN